MRSIPSGLAAELAAGTTTLCWCWRVLRRDGQALGFTDHDRPLTFGGVTYEAATGFTASEIESSLGLSIDNLEVDSALSSYAITAEDITAGRFDNATIEIWRVDWRDPARRILSRRGSTGEVTRGAVAFHAETRGLAHALGQEDGRTYQRICGAVLGDARCGVNLAASDLHGAATILTTLDDRYLTVDGLDDFAEGWFTHGHLVFETGANAGIQLEIRQHLFDGSEVALTLWQRAPLPIMAGDVVKIVAGCDRTFATCHAKFANRLNFRGFPHIPGNDAVLRVAKKSDPQNDGSSFFN